MTTAHAKAHSEGLKTARLLMVLSSISPLFSLWAIRGNGLVPDHFFISFCALMVVLPNAILWLRILMAKRNNDRREITVGSADDHRDHILVYLFAMLLPFYSEDLSTMRDLAAALTALSLVVFTFWHLNLHYMNLIFAVLQYRVFTVYSPMNGNPLSGKMGCVIITRRVTLSPSETLIAYRLSDTVFLEI